MKNKHGLLIYALTHRPPHYIVIDGQEKLAIKTGRNNVFIAITVFLIKFRKHAHRFVTHGKSYAFAS